LSLFGSTRDPIRSKSKNSIWKSLLRE